MLISENTITKNDTDVIKNFIDEFDSDIKTVNEEKPEITVVSKYISSLVCSQYRKSVEEIENTKLGSTIKRKRSLQQVMQESFFYGANRFGNNFIC